MHIEPSAQTFAARYAAGEPQIVWTKLVADLETPVSAYLKVTGGRSKIQSPMGFLLESVEGGAARGRYSMIGLDPDIIWRCLGDRAEINRQALTQPEARAEKLAQGQGDLASPGLVRRGRTAAHPARKSPADRHSPGPAEPGQRLPDAHHIRRDTGGERRRIRAR